MQKYILTLIAAFVPGAVEKSALSCFFVITIFVMVNCSVPVPLPSSDSPLGLSAVRIYFIVSVSAALFFSATGSDSPWIFIWR